MALNLKNPLVIFDLETTGISISQDRIIEYSFIKVYPNQEREIRTERINPTIPIPAESSMIHGIYDKDVAEAPTFKQGAKNLVKWLEGCDLGGFNVIKFDVPMLVEEFLRADVDFETKNRKLIDAQKFFHLMEKRNLTAAYKFYCNKPLDNAHSAEADTLATLAVLEAQVERYENKEVNDNLGNKIGDFQNDMTALHNLTFTKMFDLAGRMVYNNMGEIVFNFGKHRNKPVKEILRREPSYFDWIMRGDFTRDTKRRLTEIRLEELKK
ncbi:MAG: exonuclease domain-containing protein [Bacteroidota bacterium]